MAPRLQSLN